MIQVLAGAKGSGKTLKLISMANEAIKTERGNIFFIDSHSRHMYDLQREIRFVNASEYRIRTVEMFYGLLCGMLSANFDITLIVVDGLLKLVDVAPAELETFFADLETISAEHGVNFIIGVSGDPADLPAFITCHLA